MSSDIIKQVLDTGSCPECKSEIYTKYGEEKTVFYCVKDREHFHLEVEFHGGEKITALLNSVEVPSEELQKIDW
ncbi:MAG: hypothetical protein ACXAB7_10235 [Candidatus Kariarchaeaceae archaeon]|jgi:hypothetical protein